MTDDINDIGSNRPDQGEPVTDLTDEHERLRTDLGGYVLGNLTLAEQQSVEARLATCAACRDELAELEGIPVLLELARPAIAAPSAAPTAAPTEAPGRASTAATGPIAAPRPAPGTGRPMATPVPVHSRSRRRRALAAAAGVIAIAATLVVGVLIGRTGEPDFGPAIALAAVSGSAAEPSAAAPSGTAALRATDHGTAVRLDLDGLPTGGSWYECTWSSGQGDQSAGTFRPDADGSVHVDLSTAATLYPGWKLTIVEHPNGSPRGEPVLEASH